MEKKETGIGRGRAATEREEEIHRQEEEVIIVIADISIGILDEIIGYGNKRVGIFIGRKLIERGDGMELTAECRRQLPLCFCQNCSAAFILFRKLLKAKVESSKHRTFFTFKTKLTFA